MSDERPLGCPCLYLEGKDGAPTLTVRFPPDLLALVKARGGATWVRGLVVQALASEASE